MDQKQILIVSQYSLFDQGLRAALKHQPDIEVVGVIRDLEAAYTQAQSLHPDVVVVIGGSEIEREKAFRLLQGVASSVIRISPTDGSMQVYRREQVGQATLDDLMAAIQTTAIRWRSEQEKASGSQQVASGVKRYPRQGRSGGMKHYIVIGLLVAIITMLVTIGLNPTQLLPQVASEEGILVDQLFGLHLRVIAFLFALIVVFVLYSVIVFRRKPGEMEEGPNVRGNATLEIVWTVIPLMTVLFFGFLGARQLGDITRPDSNEMVVEVTGQQFAWRFHYPEYDIDTTVLNLPRGRQILLKLTSIDVIHSFWVPEFRIKQDAVPGMVTELRITPSKVGQYKLRCAELCGTGHYSMVADVVVMEPDDFDAWVSAQTAEAASAPSAAEGSASTKSEAVNLVESGAQIAQSQGCLGCHSTDGSPLVGPTWLGVYGSEEELQDGTTVLADEAYIKRSIVEPGAQITQGYDNLMPATYEGTLSSEEINALVAYIESLAQ